VPLPADAVPLRRSRCRHPCANDTEKPLALVSTNHAYRDTEHAIALFESRAKGRLVGVDHHPRRRCCSGKMGDGAAAFSRAALISKPANSWPKPTGHGAPCPIWCTAGPERAWRRRGALAAVRGVMLTLQRTPFRARPRHSDRHQHNGPRRDRDFGPAPPVSRPPLLVRLIWARRSIRPAVSCRWKDIETFAHFNRRYVLCAIWTTPRPRRTPFLSRPRLPNGYLLAQLLPQVPVRATHPRPVLAKHRIGQPAVHGTVQAAIASRVA